MQSRGRLGYYKIPYRLEYGYGKCVIAPRHGVGRGPWYDDDAMDISQQHQQLLLDAARMGIRETLRAIPTTAIPATNDSCSTCRAAALSRCMSGCPSPARCIGRLQSTDPLIKSIHEMAQSVTRDPRFVNNPVTLQELPTWTWSSASSRPWRRPPIPWTSIHHRRDLPDHRQPRRDLPATSGPADGMGREQLLERLCTEKMAWPQRLATAGCQASEVQRHRHRPRPVHRWSARRRQGCHGDDRVRR